MNKNFLKSAAALLAIPLAFQAAELCLPEETTASAAQLRYYGDLDGDGRLTVFDLSIMKSGARDFSILDAAQLQLADVNNDQWLGIDDIRMMQDYILGKIDKFPAGVSCEIEEPTVPTEPPQPIEEFAEANLAKHGASLPSKGDANLVVFYVDFPDCRYTYDPDVELIEKISFGEADSSNECYPFESISAFYGRASKGAQNFKGKVFRYTAKENAAVYGPDKVKLAKECYDAFADEFDFTTMDGNNDGKIDATLFTVPAEAGDEYWWPCAGAFGAPEYRVDGMAVGHIITGFAQIISPTDYFDYTSSYCHELGHCMGLPDYYLYSGDDSEGMHGAAGIELMDTDAASDLSAFSKLVCGWFRKDQIQIYDPTKDTQSFTLTNAQTEAGNCLIIPYGELAGDYFSEYFIVEYSSLMHNNSAVSQKAWWTKTGEGVRVYHIDATTEYGWNVFFKYSSGSEFTNNDAGRRLIRIIDDTDTDNFYHAGDVIDSSISGFHWYDSNGGQTIEPGIKISVDSFENDTYTVTVSKE